MFLERRDRSANYYSRLQKQTLDMLQQLSGKVWTDFNVHDPGVTIADVFNYALYELHYVFQFPFESFLNIAPDNVPNYLSEDLFGVKDIFGESIVTASDYERLINENVRGVSACRVCVGDDMLYRIEVEVNDADQKQIVGEVRALYHANRNLCENLGDIIITDSLPSNKYTDESFRPNTLVKRNTGETYPVISQDYYSMQNHFPECYGLSERGISGVAPSEYRAQVMQLKAYLLIFDYLLADAGIQAGNIGLLLSLSDELPSADMPDVGIRDIEKLIDRERMGCRSETPDKFWNTQRSRFLDVLDSIYGENTKALFARSDTKEQNRKRAAIIPDLPVLNRNRFRSFNILDCKDKMPAIKRIVGLVAGVEVMEEIPVSDLFARYRLQLVDDKTFFTRYKQKFSVGISAYTEAGAMEKVPLLDVSYHDRVYDDLYTRINLLWHNLLYQSFLIYGSDISNYRILNKWEKGYLLVFKIPKGKGWIVAGQFYEKETLITFANLFCGFIKQLSVKSRNFYLLEHILLNSKETKSSAYDELSVIYPCWAKEFGKEKCREKIKERLPAHIRVKFVALPMQKIVLFEDLYYKWRMALSERDESLIEMLSVRLLSLLNDN